MNMSVSISLNVRSNLSISRYMNISVRISFKVNRKINVNMIVNVSECEY